MTLHQIVVFPVIVVVMSALVEADKHIVKVMDKGHHQISISSVAQPLPADLWYLMCNMPTLPPGEHLCKPHDVRDPGVDLDATWADICNSVALILGYAKGTCLAVESPISSEHMYHVCALNALPTDDPQNDECSVYLTTEKLNVPLPRDQNCAKNGYKVLYERVSN